MPKRWFEEAELEDDEDFEEGISQARSARVLFEMMIWLRASGKLSARLVCMLAFWCQHAGAAGVDELSMPPWTKSTSNCQRKIDTALGFKEHIERKYRYLTMPGYAPWTGRGVQHRLAVRPPHECLGKEIRESDEASMLLQEGINDRALPPAYFSHPVVQTYHEHRSTLRLYMMTAPLFQHTTKVASSSSSRPMF